MSILLIFLALMIFIFFASTNSTIQGKLIGWGIIVSIAIYLFIEIHTGTLRMEIGRILTF